MGAAAAPPPSAEALAKQFMSRAQATLSGNGLDLTPDGKAQLQDDMTAGAQRMVFEQRTTPDYVGKAHESVSIYANGVVKEAQAANLKQVPAGIIQKAKQFFCPGLWPFC